jgi:outer membrane immunogenic protein
MPAGQNCAGCALVEHHLIFEMGDIMRRTSLLFAAATIIGSTQLSYGADMPVKAPVSQAPPVVVYNWTGCYVGGHAGYGWGRSESTATTANSNFPVGFVFDPTDLRGAIAGGQAGCNYQMDHLVFGVEGDFSWSDIKGDETSISPLITGNSTTSSTKLTWLADITGRAGYAWNNWLLYAKGGAAWTHVDGSSVTGPVVVNTTAGSETRSGWIIGGGVEWGFASHWSAKIEYDYFDFGTADIIRVTASNGFQNHRDSKLTVNVAEIALNFHF